MSSSDSSTNTSQPLSGNLFVVTGSSTGIGKSIAVTLAAAGANIVLHGRNQSPNIEETAAEIEQLGQKAHVVLADFADLSALDGFVESAFGIEGRVTGWVNNAGGDVLTGQWKEQPLEAKLEYLWKTDVASTLLLSRNVGKRLIDQSRVEDENSATRATIKPSIVTIGWDQAWQGMAGESGELFSTTKGAIMAMTKSLAHSLAPVVRVNCIAPGWIQTKWGESATPYWDNRAKSESLMNRWGKPEDVARAALFLCSDQSDFISGQIIPVNGGFRNWQE